MSSIFISYRREDAGWAGRLRGSLDQQGMAVFDDTDILPGDEWPLELERALSECQAVLVVVGPEWAKKKNLKRLFGNEDWVRREITSALARRPSVLVIPVLIEKTKWPSEALLPQELHELRKLELFPVTNKGWHTECALLIERLTGWLKKRPAASRAPLPDLLPFLCDRTNQEDGLMDAVLVAKAKHRKLMCVVQGHKLEGHNGFVIRVQESPGFQRLLGAETTGIAVERLDWNSTYAQAGEFDALLRKNLLRRVLRDPLATDDQLRQYLRSPGRPQLLVLHLAAEDYRAGGKALLDGLAGAWNRLFRVSGKDGADEVIVPTHALLLWVNLCFDGDEVALDTLKLPEPGVVLELFQPVSGGDIIEWMSKNEIRPHLLGRESEFRDLDKHPRCIENGRLHMDHFADAVHDILNH
jgi:hypothetical protein